jgi:hypothetical protein
MTKQQTKQNFIFNLMYQILENQTNAVNGLLTNEAHKKSNKLMSDCLAFIDVDKKKVKTETNKNREEFNEIFNYWNESKEWQYHKCITSHKSAMSKQLKSFSAKEIIESINNYINIVEDEKCYFSHKWTLTDFLNRGFMNFLDTAKPFENYNRSFKNGSRTNKQTTISDEKRESITANFK